MSRCLLFLFLLVQPLIAAERALPEQPSGRISDQSEVFDSLTRRNLSRALAEEYSQSKISVYIATMKGLHPSEASAYADRLREAWISAEMAVVVLYGEDTDEIYVSLSDAAFKKASVAGPLLALASEIDVFNRKGPAVALPKTAMAILDRLRVKPAAIVPTPTPAAFRESVIETSLFLLIGLIICGLAIFGLIKFIRHCRSHTIFVPGSQIRSGRVAPLLGSALGGINTAEGKY